MQRPPLYIGFDNKRYRLKSHLSLNALGSISQINLFVGANNSGKSTFLRTLFLSNRSFLMTLMSEEVINDTNQIIEQTHNDISDCFNSDANFHIRLENNHILVFAGPKSLWHTGRMPSCTIPFWKTRSERMVPFGTLPYPIRDCNSLVFSHPNLIIGEDFAIGMKNIQLLAEKLQELLQKLNNDWQNLVEDFTCCYIPVLRGIRTVGDKTNDPYNSRTSDDYFKTNNSSEIGNIFTGQVIFKTLLDRVTGTQEEKESVIEYQSFLSESFFDGKGIIITPRNKEQTCYVKIGDQIELPIHQIGDGIQSVIILTFLPWFNKESTWFFIEEPELHLHPGFQRALMQTYTNLPRHRFFFTTHSNHFLDTTPDISDVSIFTFRSGESEKCETMYGESQAIFEIEQVNSGHRNSLELLGVRNSSVFLVNATIWVEGITDRKYFRRMLISYMETTTRIRKYREDIHYAFIEYGGSNLTHWSFLEESNDDSEDDRVAVKNLTARAMVIADGDGNSKAERKAKLRKEIGDRFLELPCHEVENTLPYSVIKNVLTEYGESEDQLPSDVKHEVYKDCKLGSFIQEKMLANNQKRKGKYAEGSGTITDKTGFCDKALPHITYDSLPESTQEVVKKIYDFIASHNQ